MLHIEVDGQPAEVIVTEVTPGRWSWTIKREGHSPIGSTIPLPTGQTAMTAALDEVRRLSAEGQDKPA